MLPAIAIGDRRKGFVLLALNGLAQAGLALVSAWLLGVLFVREPDRLGLLVAVVLLVVAFGLAWLRYHEFGTAERLGQDYVLDTRLRLLQAEVGYQAGVRQRHGIAMTRLTNDLASVKNWISLGISRTLVGSISILGACAALWLWSPTIAPYCIAIVLGILLAGFLLAVPLRRNLRTGRRLRGRLSARVGELLLARETVSHFGGLENETRRVRRLSARMASALSLRMALVGAMQGLADLLTPAAAVTLLYLSLGDPELAAHKPLGALIIVGFMAGPVRDLMRVADYWLAYREACRRLGAVLSPLERRRSSRAKPMSEPVVEPGCSTATEASRSSARHLPALHIRSGESEATKLQATDTRGDGAGAVASESGCDAVTAKSPAAEAVDILAGTIAHLEAAPAAARSLIRWLGGLDDGAAPFVSIDVDGVEIDHRDASVRRRHFKIVSPDLALLRRSGERNVTDFARQSSKADRETVLETCGLAGDPEFEAIRSKRLRENGSGVSASLAARLQLARAVLASPRVLLVDDAVFLDDPRAQSALLACVQKWQLSAIVVTPKASVVPTSWHPLLR